MTDPERFKLLFGPYSTPQFEYGTPVSCEVRGLVTIVEISTARIPWPIGKLGRAKTLVIYGQLADAVRRESNQAVCFWWGVTPQTVSKWRKELGAPKESEGTVRLRRDYALTAPIVEARKKAHAKANDPVRRAKISAAKRGKKRPRRAVQAMAASKRGKPLSEEHRRKLSVAHRRRGTIPPKAGRAWKPEEDELVRTLKAADAARKTGRTLQSVYGRRHELGVPDGRFR